MPTLYISGHEIEARLNDRRVRLETLVGNDADQPAMTVPVHDIDRVVIIGYPKISLQLLHHFIYQKIPVYFLSPSGRWVSSMQPNVSGNTLRKLRQYEIAGDKAVALTVACSLINAKIRNMRRVLQRLAANRSQSNAQEQLQVCDSLQALANQVQQAETLASVRGFEGAATAIYFHRLADFFPPEMPFQNRSRRPPKNAANALMSWTYAIITAEIETEIRCAGLEPCLGFLHEISYGRPSLAVDLLEPLRAPLGDMMVMKMLNKKYLKQEHFAENQENGGINLKKESKKIFFLEYEKTMERKFSEKKDGKKVTFRQVIRNMVREICELIERKKSPTFFLMP